MRGIYGNSSTSSAENVRQASPRFGANGDLVLVTFFVLYLYIYAYIRINEELYILHSLFDL
jgi:hypothetical protein